MTKIKIFAFMLALFVPWSIASCFEDGTSMTLTQSEIKSAPDFRPVWGFS